MPVHKYDLLLWYFVCDGSNFGDAGRPMVSRTDIGK